MSVYKGDKFHRVEEEGFRKYKHKGICPNVPESCVDGGNEKSWTAGDAFLMGGM